ncbi:interleukin-like EMT inducer domain-containing protein, partial [Parvimonas sp. D9]|uniref:interleukin-like EMT inducer domain-containing protein n=1 Tax=Parvimonas sp. D9 TaxID=3110689 RepID=UPI003A7F1B4A
MASDMNSNTINYAETFDVYGSAQRAQDMANVLMSMAPGRTVIVISNDEPVNNRFANGLGAAMESVGAG